MAGPASVSALDRQWFIVSRWREYEGEARANLLRIVAVGALYAIQLVNYYLLGTSSPAFQRQATLLAVAWTLVSLAVLVCQRWRIFPAWLKFASTGADILLVTATTHLAGGPTSPVAAAYFLILALSALRGNVPLIAATTVGCMLGYEAVVGANDPTWFDEAHTTPVAEQLTMQAILALTGLVLSQVIGRTRKLADNYCERAKLPGN